MCARARNPSGLGVRWSPGEDRTKQERPARAKVCTGVGRGTRGLCQLIAAGSLNLLNSIQDSM
jgi:hypothetical protein